MMDEEEEQVRKEKQHAKSLSEELRTQRLVWETEEKKRKVMLEEAKAALHRTIEDSKRQHQLYLEVGGTEKPEDSMPAHAYLPLLSPFPGGKTRCRKSACRVEKEYRQSSKAAKRGRSSGR